MKKRNAVLLVVLVVLCGILLRGMFHSGAKNGDPVRAPEATAAVQAIKFNFLTPVATRAQTDAPASQLTEPPAPTASYSVLSPGDKGDDVARLQQRLNELGFDVGSADGDYGKKTTRGVERLQEAAGLAVTGVADEQTQAVLWRESAPTEQPTATPQPEEESVQAGVEYILNKTTGVFHYPSCSSVDQMKESNKASFTGDREEVIDMGYRPCKRCDP